MDADVPDLGAYNLDTKLGCLSWWEFPMVPGTYQVINKRCLREQTLANFNGLVNASFLRHHPLYVCTARSLPWRPLAPAWELQQLFIILYVACDAVA